jgi:hypothetical protein
MRSVRSRGALAAAVALTMCLGPDVAVGQGGEQRAAGPVGATTATPPAWVAWQALYQLLSVGDRSPAMVERMVVRRAGLTGTEAAALLTAGRRYLEAIARIDADARAEVDRRWGADLPGVLAARPPREGAAPSTERPVLLAAGKTLLQMARDSGMYAEIEAKKQEALAAHLREVDIAIGSAARAAVAAWIASAIAPRIATAESGTRVAPPVERAPGPAGVRVIESFRR